MSMVYRRIYNGRFEVIEYNLLALQCRHSKKYVVALLLLK